MNTPEPCDKCEHLYVNYLFEDDPFYLAECKLGHSLGPCDDYEELPKPLKILDFGFVHWMDKG